MAAPRHVTAPAAVFSMRDNTPLQGVSTVELKAAGKGVSKTAAYDGKYL